MPQEPLTPGDRGPAGSENPSTCVDLFYGNREIPCLATADGAAVRAGNLEGATRR